jgi:hypothetical protein
VHFHHFTALAMKVLNLAMNAVASNAVRVITERQK